MSSKQKTTPAWKQYNRPWYAKFGHAVGDYFKGIGLLLWSVIKAIPFKLRDLFVGIGRCFQGLWLRFVRGDWRTKISYLIMGFGDFSRGPHQFLKGFLWFAVEALFVVYMVLTGGHSLWMLGGLGDVPDHYEPGQIGLTEGDNSLKILLFGVLSLFILVFFVYMWIKSTKDAYETCEKARAGKELSTAKQQISYALNDGYHVTVLALPIIGILVITVLPLVCNILIAFTNYDDAHRPPTALFDWVGFETFGTVLKTSYGTVFWQVLGWTLIWAVFATFTNFFFGMFLAMMINKKSIKIKAFWRICFVTVIAVPDFVSLMLMNQFFSYSEAATLTGPFNTILRNWFGIKGANVDWFGSKDHNGILPRVMVIVVNMWRGMPFTMLATSGILMNIPEELYESSRIDGAGPFRRFVSITFPYIMFVMGPQLITTFTGNINNFNVIYLLTGGGPDGNVGGVMIGKTDLLVTWLYSLTLETQHPQYNVGSVIGLFTFLVSSFFALIVFNSSKSIKQEDTFQ